MVFSSQEEKEKCCDILVKKEIGIVWKIPYFSYIKNIWPPKSLNCPWLKNILEEILHIGQSASVPI
jgi:hypothetical protein